MHDATSQVATGYMCLAATIGLTISFFTVLAINPRHIEAHVLTVLNGAGCYYAFLKMKRRQDPRPLVEWVILLYLVTAATISFRHSGIIAPVVFSLPAVAGLAALFVRPTMRLVLLVVGIAVAVSIFVFASGLAGTPSPYSFQTRSIMGYFAMAISTIALGGLAWLSNLSRDFALDRLTEANTLIVENAARSRVALEAARVGLWDVPDAELRKFHVSESFQSITGYTADEFNDVFSALDQFVHPEDIVQLREAFALGRKRMSRLRVDFRLKTKARGYRWFSARARYSRNPDGTTRISGSLQDINFIKAAEEALRAGRDRAREANKAKSDFIAVMSHEVRTPLNAILGSVEVLKRGEPRQGDRRTGRPDRRCRAWPARHRQRPAGRLEDRGRQARDIALARLISPRSSTRTVDFWRPQATRQGPHTQGRLRRSADMAPDGRRRTRPADHRQPSVQRHQVHRCRRRHGHPVHARTCATAASKS